MHTSSSSAGSPARTDVEGGACAVGGRAVSLSLSLFPGALSRVSLPLSLWEKPEQEESGGGGGGLSSSSSSSDPAVAAAYLGKLN